MALHEVKPWGRCLAEYRAMFSLSDDDRRRPILDCAGGPASFNAEWTGLGGTVVSCDPLYVYDSEAIANRIRETTPEMIEHVNRDRDRYVWTAFDGPAQMIESRLSTMTRFLADYPLGLREGRYCPDSLPRLSFADNEFELALCSHFLFTYSELLPLDFHLESVRELARVAAEVRIFPLLDLSDAPSPHVPQLIVAFEAKGYWVEKRRVSYEFQRRGDQMLVVSPPVSGGDDSIPLKPSRPSGRNDPAAS